MNSNFKEFEIDPLEAEKFHQKLEEMKRQMNSKLPPEFEAIINKRFWEIL